MKLINYSLLISLLTPSLSFAFFCPNNFNQIDFGYTPDQVTQLCGKPDKQESKTQDPMTPQEWIYFISQTVETGTMEQAQGTLKTSITFDSNGKVINLSVNGIGVGSSTICGPTNPIQLGDTLEAIQKACGKPSFINKQSNPDAPVLGGDQPKKKITTFTYNTNPSVKLVFEDDKLKSKE